VNANLSRLGYRSDLMNAYEWDGVLEKAIYHYRNMLRSRDKFFGPAHDSTIRIRSYLVDTLKRDNQLQEAIQHAQENIKYGVKHTGCRDCLTLKSQLAGLYASVGQLDKAETLTRAIIGEYQTSENDDHPTRLYDQNNLAFIFIAQAKFDKGLELALNVERECLIRLGVRHASTLEARKTVAIAYDACDELETAVDVSQMLLETRRSCVPVDHPLLVDALVSLGIQCYRLGRYDDALECYNDIKASMNRKPELGAIAVVSVANYASGLMRRSKIGEAVEILESLVEESEKYLGENNKIVIAAMGNLAFAYSKLEQYAKAEALAIRVLDLRRKTFPENHPHAITALKNLSHVLIVQSKWAESARLGLQELNILESIAATPESDKIVLGLATARYFIYGKCWNEAHCLLARVLTWQKSCHSEGEPIEYLSATILSTVCSLKLGHLNTVREEVLEILKALQIPFKEDPNELLSYLVSLGKRCMEENFTKEAGQVFGGSFILATQLPGVLPPVKAMLSTSISKYIQNHPTFEEYLVFNPAVLDFNI
jgi:tetratricopeptide (TPR) repeat protein